MLERKILGGGGSGASVSTANTWTATQDFAKGITVSESSTGTESTAHKFKLAPRTTTLIGYPVPVLKPAAGSGNVNMSLDICPIGSPSNASSDSGLAWMDVCDVDVETAGASAVGTARVGVWGSYVEFGTRGYGGNTPKDVYLGQSTLDPGQQITGTAIALHPGSQIECKHWTNATTAPGNLVIGADGSEVIIGSGFAIATNATYGFLSIPTCAGAPTGTPVSGIRGACVPIVFDTTNNKLWVNNSTWKGVVLS